MVDSLNFDKVELSKYRMGVRHSCDKNHPLSHPHPLSTKSTELNCSAWQCRLQQAVKFDTEQFVGMGDRV